MKRLLALILACICILSLAACDLDPTSGNPEVDNGSNNGTVISPDQGLTPGGDDMLNSDGTLKIPEPDSSAELTVDASTWQTLLSKDAIRAAMLDNSMTTITSDNNSEQYQMYYCAGGRYGSILVGNYRSETICGLSDGTVYVFKRSAAEGSWTRDTYAGSYDEYVANNYLNGAMQFLSGIADVFAQAQYEESEKAYVIEEYSFSPAADVNIIAGKLKIQFVGEKLYSITLYLSNDGVSGAVTTVFGATAAFDLPADFQSGNSGSVSVAPDTDHSEPAESVCSKDRWERLFSENRILDSLVETHGILKIYNGSQEYLFQITHDYSRIVSDTNSGYQELIISHHDRYQRDSKNGQWLYYSGGDHLQQYDTILTEKMDILVELLAEVKDLYDQAHFNSSTKCFLIQDVRFTHNTFGNVIVDYFVYIQGGMIEKIEANIRANNTTWYLTTEEGVDKDITIPTDYVDMSKDEHGKRP